MKIDRQHYEAAYELSKRVRSGELQLTEARDILLGDGVNPSSAVALLNNLRHMRQGTCYKWTMSKANSNDYLTWLRRDYGEEGHALAVSSFRQHIEYYAQTSGGPLISLREVLAKHENLLPSEFHTFRSPEEISPSTTHLEGNVRQVLVNSYERNTAARDKCLAHYGTACSVCSFDFGTTYGDIGAGFIHVHHLREISSIGKEYEVDPIKDLRPVCPNCHAMLHHRSLPSRTIEALRQLLSSSH